MCVEYVESLVLRLIVLVRDCTVQYECRKIVNWTEAWCEGGALCVGGAGVVVRVRRLRERTRFYCKVPFLIIKLIIPYIQKETASDNQPNDEQRNFANKIFDALLTL